MNNALYMCGVHVFLQVCTGTNYIHVQLYESRNNTSGTFLYHSLPHC